MIFIHFSNLFLASCRRSFFFLSLFLFFDSSVRSSYLLTGEVVVVGHNNDSEGKGQKEKKGPKGVHSRNERKNERRGTRTKDDEAFVLYFSFFTYSKNRFFLYKSSS